MSDKAKREIVARAISIKAQADRLETLARSQDIDLIPAAINQIENDTYFIKCVMPLQRDAFNDTRGV